MANPKTKYGRYCDSCGHEHGPLYVCPSYDDATKGEIAEQTKRTMAWLSAEEKAADERRRTGLPAKDTDEALPFLRMFMGDDKDAAS